jgi:hypothetical protein
MKKIIVFLFSILNTDVAREFLLEVATMLAEKTQNQFDDELVKIMKGWIEEIENDKNQKKK